jgi:hypothetical protein
LHCRCFEKALAEFVLCRQAVGRGGEYVFLRWSEAFWDDFYQALDLDWTIIKQKDTKGTLLFGDRHIYCLCPYFAIGAYMLMGGLCHGDSYVFPALHVMKRESVADGLTKAMKRFVKIVYGKEFSDQFGTWSLRKAGLTEMRCNRNLWTQKEYARSGHVAPDQNPNAEGYVETTPAMSAPGGKALAGYSDPHDPAYPMSFECLNVDDKDMLDRFLSKLFVNDVECMKASHSAQILPQYSLTPF